MGEASLNAKSMRLLLSHHSEKQALRHGQQGALHQGSSDAQLEGRQVVRDYHDDNHSGKTQGHIGKCLPRWLGWFHHFRPTCRLQHRVWSKWRSANDTRITFSSIDAYIGCRKWPAAGTRAVNGESWSWGAHAQQWSPTMGWVTFAQGQYRSVCFGGMHSEWHRLRHGRIQWCFPYQQCRMLQIISTPPVTEFEHWHWTQTQSPHSQGNRQVSFISQEPTQTQFKTIKRRFKCQTPGFSRNISYAPYFSTSFLISFVRSSNADIKILTISAQISLQQSKEPHRVLDSIVTSQSKRTTPRPGQHCYITEQKNHTASWTALLHHRAKEPHRVLDSIVTSQSKRTTPRPGQHCYITEQKNHTASWTALLHHRAFSPEPSFDRFINLISSSLLIGWVSSDSIEFSKVFWSVLSCSVLIGCHGSEVGVSHTVCWSKGGEEGRSLGWGTLKRSTLYWLGGGGGGYGLGVGVHVSHSPFVLIFLFGGGVMVWGSGCLTHELCWFFFYGGGGGGSWSGSRGVSLTVWSVLIWGWGGGSHGLGLRSVQLSPCTLATLFIAVVRKILFIFVLRKKGSKTKERMKEEEIEKGDCGPPTRKVFFWFCRTWTKRYLITSQTRVKRVSRIHHRTILKRVWPMMHLHPRSLDRPLGPSFRSEMEKDVQQ